MGKSKKTQPGLLSQFIRLALLSGAVFIFLLMIVIGLLGYIYRDQIKQTFLLELNRRLNAEIYAEDIQIKLFRSFPKASVAFQNTGLVIDSDIHGNDTLLHAASIQLEFNIPDILKRDFTVRQINIAHGYFHPAVFADHSTNWELWEHSPTSDPREIHFDIQRLNIQNLSLRFSHHPDNHLIHTHVERLRLRITAENGNVSIRAGGHMTMNECTISQVIIPGNKPLNMDARIDLFANGNIHINKTHLTWNQHNFIIDGQFSRGEEALRVKSSLSGKDINVHDLLHDLPANWHSILQKYEPKGILNVDATFEGFLGNGHIPQIQSSYLLTRGSFVYPDKNFEIKVREMAGRFTNGRHQHATDSRLYIDRLSGTVDNSTISGTVALKNLEQPYVSFDLNGMVAGNDLVKWQLIEPLSSAGGSVNMHINFAGRVDENMQFARQNLLDASISGYMDFRDFEFTLKKRPELPYHAFNGRTIFNNNYLEIEQLSGAVADSDFLFNGRMVNFLPYVFIPGESLVILASLQSGFINLDHLLRSGEPETGNGFRLPERVNLELDASINHFQFRLFRATQMTGSLRLNNRQLFADRLAFHTMDGRVIMQGVLDNRKDNLIHMYSNANLNQVDIHQLFYQTGNFGQESITKENIYGSVSAELFFSANWDTSLTIDWQSMETIANLTIDNGRLVNYQPMIALSRFIRTDDFTNVSFSTLQNEIHISDRRITIPQMEINSSALNLQLSGEHTFDNEIDYRMQVLLSDLLARQHRERRNPQEQYGDIIDDGLGRTTLFLRLTGTASDPVFRYDHQGVREKIMDDLRQERETFRNIIRSEFRFLSREKSDTTNQDAPGERAKQRERLRKQEEGEFIIEWEEW
ncbi:MAG: hypothetical protein EA394_04850 [Bacteroidia bacterium]|nr:MAG: hypothetical protein EA394_04850 [Bacteroidia bacterium]